MGLKIQTIQYKKEQWAVAVESLPSENVNVPTLPPGEGAIFVLNNGPLPASPGGPARSHANARAAASNYAGEELGAPRP